MQEQESFHEDHKEDADAFDLTGADVKATETKETRADF